MSLHMCKQLFIGAHGQDLFYFIDCTEDREKNNLNAAVAKLAAADGIERATLVSVKR
jgi:hypothetical protein